MKRYRFRLERLLQLRRAEEDRAQAAVHQAEAALRTALAARDVELARYRELRRTSEPVSMERFRAEEAAARMAASTLLAAERFLAVKAESAVRARVAYAEAARRVAALERLDERRRAAHDEAERRSEVATIDDLVTARLARGGQGQPRRGDVLA